MDRHYLRIIFLSIIILISNCANLLFLKQKKTAFVQIQYEFEDMQVVDGPAVLPSADDNSLEFWSWGTAILDLRNTNIRDSVNIKFRVREDFAGKQHALFEIVVPCKFGTSMGYYSVTDSNWYIIETNFPEVIPGIWEFSFINDYPQSDTFPKGRNLFADWIVFECDTTIEPEIRTDTLYYADLSLPKTVWASSSV